MKILFHTFKEFRTFTKKYFSERIQLIIDKCDKMVMEHNKRISEYQTVKTLYQSVLSKESVDFKKYQKIREMFESIRYLQQC